MAIALLQSVKKIMQDKAYGHVIAFNANGTPQVTMRSRLSSIRGG